MRNYTFTFVIFFCSLFQLGRACLVVDNSNIRGFVAQYVSSYAVYNANHPNCSIGDWNTSLVTDMSYLFRKSYSFNSDLSSWDVSNVVTMRSMFEDCYQFNSDISSWDTRNVVSMQDMFEDCYRFNSDISSWDTRNVVSMENMFQQAYKFNKDVSSWNVSNVVSMRNMFKECYDFNSDISSWDVSNVVSMQFMFDGNRGFNQNLSSWKTGNVEEMKYMFANAVSFNGDISSWNVSRVTDMSSMFLNTPKFNIDISSWDVSRVTDMAELFSGSSSFNQPIGTWSTNKVTSMRSMFADASSFDQPLNAWDTSNVVLMYNMFRNARSYNQPLDAWDTSNVQLMSSMFEGAIAYDQPLDSWNTQNVVGMTNMFQNAHSFDQPLDRWDIRNVRTLSRMFYNATSYKQLFCWELNDKIYDGYLTETNGAVNKFETAGFCNRLDFITEDNLLDKELEGILIGTSTISVSVVAIAVMLLRSRKNFVERENIPLLEVKITCLKVGFGSIIFVTATYVLLTVVATNEFRPDIIEGSIAANADQGVSFTLFKDQPLVYQISLKEEKKYAVQVSDSFDGFANLYDPDLKVVSRITDFEVNLDKYIEAVQPDAGSSVYFPAPPICSQFSSRSYTRKFKRGLREICPLPGYHYHPYKPTYILPPFLLGGQNQIQPATVNVQFYKPDGRSFGAESYTDKHYLEVKSENTILLDGKFMVSEVVTVMQGQPVLDTLKHAELSNFYELDVLKNTLYEISITGVDSDVMYVLLLNQDGKRLGQSHHYPANFVAPDECKDTLSGCGGDGYPIAPSNITSLQNKFFFEADFTGTVILRVFIGREFVDTFTGITEPSRKPDSESRKRANRKFEVEYEELWSDVRRTPKPFTLECVEIEKATNSAVLNFNGERRNAKTVVEVNINQTASIIYSQIEIIEYVAIFDTKGQLIASIDVSIPDDFMVAYEQIKTLTVYNQSEVERVWLEFNIKKEKFPQVQNFTIEVIPFVNNTAETGIPSTGSTSTPAPKSSSGFVDPADQYAFCQPDPELLTLQGTCLDGVLYYCRNDKYPNNIYPEDISLVPVEALSGVCTCVEFICSVIPSGDVDFTLYLEYFHLVEAIILAPVAVASGFLTVSLFCSLELKRFNKSIGTSLLLFLGFSSSFIQDILQYRVVKTAQFFRDVEDLYISLAFRNNSLDGEYYLNNAAIELIKERGISEDYIRMISLSSQVFYVIANLFAILVFLNICLVWASTAYTSVLANQEERRKKFNRFKTFVRSLEFLLFSYSLYFTVKIVMDPNQYDNSLSIMEFLACCLIIAGYSLSIFLLLPKLINMSSRAKASSHGNDGVSVVIKSVTVTSTGIIVCLLGVAVGHYYAIVEMQNYEDLLKARNSVSVSGVFLAQHVCQIAGQGWILLDLLNKLKQFRMAGKSGQSTEESKKTLFCFSSIHHFFSARFISKSSSQPTSSVVSDSNIKYSI